jgi:hypothetical protein
LSTLDPNCFTQDTLHSRLVGPRASLDGCGEENISCSHCSFNPNSKNWHQFYSKIAYIKLLKKKFPHVHILSQVAAVWYISLTYTENDPQISTFLEFVNVLYTTKKIRNVSSIILTIILDNIWNMSIL